MDIEPIKVDPVKRVTLTEMIIKQIATQITSGQLKPGSKLPDERTFSEMFEVSRSRIREALRALSLSGLVSIRPGEGSFVNENTVKIPEETLVWMYYEEMHNHDEVYSARKLIETEVYMTCFDNRTPEILKHMDDLGERFFETDINNISSEEFYNMISDLDLFVGQSCQNRIYYKLMQTIVMLRKESSMKILNLVSSRESAIYYRKKIISSFHQDDRKKVAKALYDFFKYSIKTITLNEE